MTKHGATPYLRLNMFVYTHIYGTNTHIYAAAIPVLHDFNRHTSITQHTNCTFYGNLNEHNHISLVWKQRKREIHDTFYAEKDENISKLERKYHQFCIIDKESSYAGNENWNARKGIHTEGYKNGCIVKVAS